MKSKIKMLRVFLLLIGAISMALSGLNWQIAIAAWIAPILLLAYTRKAKRFEFFLFFIVIAISGGVSQTCNNLLHLPEVNIFNGVAFGILTTIPYLVDRFFYKSGNRFYYTLIFPATVALIEFAASHAIGTWGSIAHTQYGFKSLMQIGAITGIYGIWFLISWFASSVNWIIDNRGNRQLIYKASIIFGSVFSLILLIGIVRLKSDTSNNQQVKVATVLSDNEIEDEMVVFRKLALDNTIIIPPTVYSDSIEITNLLRRTKEAILNDANIIVWNEIALILNQEQKKYVLSEVKELSTSNKVFILISFLEECVEPDMKPFNNVSILAAPDGETKWEYKKSFLQPTAEAPIINVGDFKLPITQTKFGTLGSVICSDLDMQHLVKQAGEQLVDILLVPAYDWDEITPLHSRMASIQAIQFGCNIVRANGKGMSAVYNTRGKEVASLNNLISENRILYAELPLQPTQTLYSIIGDALIGLCFTFLLIIIVGRIFNRKKNIDN